MRLLKLWLPVIVWAAVILSASNDSFSADESRGWLERLFRRDLPEAVNYTIRKVGHVIFYGILGALAYRANRRITVALGVTLLVALADEYSQGLSRTRTGSVWDVLLDLFGGGLAIGIWNVLVERRASARRAIESSAG
ncbi:MAG TPA: VanZ family protein [Thermoanaerobaculia bacterium]|nr:VanZ family protein [Thermoanaerobaculia bacterium]